MEGGIEFPIDPLDSFEDQGGDADLSQVTVFLILGAIFGAENERESAARDIEKTREYFPIPDVKEKFRLDTHAQVQRFIERYEFSASDFIYSPYEDGELGGGRRRREIANELVRKIYKQSNKEDVADLILLGLGMPNELIRVAAAISFLDIFNELSIGIRALISIAEDHIDEIAGAMAETALMRFGFAGIAGPPNLPTPPKPSTHQTATLLVHGSHFSFVGGKIGDWWRPNGSFHSFVKSNYRPNLYSKPDCFTWSGGWSDHARRLAAKELRDWARNRKLSKLDILAHSHGGNVVMWATQLGLEVDTLVLLSCPEHLSRYEPEWSRVSKAISYQIQMDWIILADGGGIYFNHQKIDDRVQSKWFRSHSDTHDPAFWQKHGISI